MSVEVLEAVLKLDRQYPPPTVEKKLPFGLVLSEEDGFFNAYLRTLGRPTSDLILPEQPSLVQKVIALAALKANFVHFAKRGNIESVHNKNPWGVLKW